MLFIFILPACCCRYYSFISSTVQCGAVLLDLDYKFSFTRLHQVLELEIRAALQTSGGSDAGARRHPTATPTYQQQQQQQDHLPADNDAVVALLIEESLKR